MATKDEYNDMKVEVALVKKDVEQLREDVKEIKNEISNIKGWAVKAFWIVATAIILQATNFVLSGGLNGIAK
jgi:chromosome segregation ATPase